MTGFQSIRNMLATFSGIACKTQQRAIPSTCLLLFALAIGNQANAGLIDRGNGMIYDTVLDVTWLQDANYADTSGVSGFGLLGWADANAWANGLSFGGFSDWRLASVDVNQDDNIVFCSGGNEVACQDNELGYMFYHNLGGTNGVQLTDFGPFLNVQSHYFARESSSLFPGNAWLFNMYFGFQGTTNQISGHWAWAVRDGDVTVSEPAPAILILIGLLGLISNYRKHALRTSA